jgi:3-oxoacyl-[acyl-carrier-protein] synthase-3
MRTELHMETRGACIMGLGSYAPERVLTNDDLSRIVDTNDEWIVDHTGIRERRIVAEDQATSDLGCEAARRAMEDAGVSPEQIQLILVATVSPDHHMPAAACLVQDKLGIKGAGAFDLVCGCTGWVQALVTGAQYIQSGALDHVLVIGAESLSRITDWTDRATCVLFGDGACAAVLGPCEPGQGLLAFRMDTIGEAAPLLAVPGGGSKMKMTPELLEEHMDCIKMNGHEVFKLAVRGCPDIAAATLEQAGIDSHEVDVLVMHQANLRIIDAAAKRLDIPYDRLPINIDRYGNTSAATIGLALDEYRRDHELKTGDIVLFVAFGAGFALASALFRWV